jgi:hypothetical protein
VARSLLARWFFARLISGLENGGDIFLRIFGSYTNYTALYKKATEMVGIDPRGKVIFGFHIRHGI